MKLEKIKSLLIFVFLLSNVSPAGDTHLRLPLRVLKSEDMNAKYGKDDFALFINDKPREILDLIKGKRSIGIKTRLGRNIILAFHMERLEEKATDAVSFFVSDILSTSDQLFIVTPINIYRIPVTYNKLRMISDIKALVKRDCRIYVKNKIIAEKNLENIVRILRNAFVNRRATLTIRVAVNEFLERYPTQFINFAHRFVLPDKNKYNQIIENLGTREGERWCIHFQQFGIFSIFFKTTRSIRPIRDDIGRFLNVNARLFLSDLAQKILNTLDFKDDMSLSDILVNSGINFNSIFFGNVDRRDSIAGQMADFISESSFESGGISLNTDNPLKALKDIIDYQDYYYDLVFKFNDKIEEKNIRVIPIEKNVKVSYKKKFKEKEIDSIIRYISKEKIKFDHFSISGNRISFSIGSLKHVRSENKLYSMLDIGIELFDKQGTSVYKDKKTLRISKNKTTISLSLPSKFRGKFKIKISALDLYSNYDTYIYRDIKIQ